MSLPPIIGINGRAQHGKDTVAGILHDLYGYERISFADQLRSFIYRQDLYTPDGESICTLVDSLGWDIAKREFPYIRKVQQTTGTDAGRALDPNLWVNAAFRNAPTGKLLVVPDMRFPNEYDAVTSRGGITWRVHRPDVPAVREHISETALDDHAFHEYIKNDQSLLHLADVVISIMDAYV